MEPALGKRRSASKKQAGPSIESIPEGTMPDDEDARIQTKAQYSLDTLWEIQQEKLRSYGFVDAPETKADFKKRMIQNTRH